MTLLLVAITWLGESRRVEVKPGFGEASESVDQDWLAIAPDGAATINSSRGYASRRTSYVGTHPPGTRLVLVFESVRHRGTHSIAELLVEAGGGTQEAVATPAAGRREFAFDPDDAYCDGTVLELPLPDGVVPNDERQEDERTESPVGTWAIRVGRTLRAKNGQPSRAEPLLEGRTYRSTAVARGRAATEFRYQSGPDPIEVTLPQAPPLRVSVVDPAGRPVKGAKVFARRVYPDDPNTIRMTVRINRAAGEPLPEGIPNAKWFQSQLPAAISGDDGVAACEQLLGDREYDLYVDAGDRGRGLLRKATTGQTRTISLAPGPPLSIEIRNASGSAATVGERISKESAAGSIVHGPFALTDGSATFRLPTPIADELTLSVSDGAGVVRTIHVNARGPGRKATVDLSEGETEFWVEPQLATPRRTVGVRFVLPDGTTVFKRSLREGAPPTFVASLFRPDRGEESGTYSDRPVKFRDGRYELRLGSDQAARIDFEGSRFDGAVISGRLYRDVPPGLEDVEFDVPVVPARRVEITGGMPPGRGDWVSAWTPYAWEGGVRDGNDSLSVSYRLRKPKPAVVEIPAAETFLLVNPAPTVVARLLPPDVAEAPVDWSAAKRTVVEAVHEDGTKLSARIQGLVPHDSGIRTPVEFRYESEKTGGEWASRAIFNLHADVPIAAVVHGYTAGAAGDTVPQVVPLTPGATHRLTFEPGRVMWVDLASPDWQPLRRNFASLSTKLSWLQDGVRVSVDENFTNQRFVGVPAEGPLRLHVRLYDWGGLHGVRSGTVDFDPSGRFVGGTAAIGVALQPEGRDGLNLTADWSRTLKKRDGDREFYRERRGRR